MAAGIEAVMNKFVMEREKPRWEQVPCDLHVIVRSVVLCVE